MTGPSQCARLLYDASPFLYNEALFYMYNKVFPFSFTKGRQRTSVPVVAVCLGPFHPCQQCFCQRWGVGGKVLVFLPWLCGEWVHRGGNFEGQLACLRYSTFGLKLIQGWKGLAGQAGYLILLFTRDNRLSSCLGCALCGTSCTLNLQLVRNSLQCF